MSFTLNSVSLFPNKLRRCFTRQPVLYETFMDVIKKYASGDINIQELLPKLSCLMADHPGILKDFNDLLPRGVTLDSCLTTLFPGSNSSETCKPSALESEASISSSRQISSAADTEGTNCSFCEVRDRSEVQKACLKNEQQKQGLAEIAKYGTFKEFAFFDKVRRLMGNDDTYLNFMRCLALYNKDVVTGSELIEILQPFTLKDPELSSELRRMLGSDSSKAESCASKKARKSSELLMEIDYASCRKHGISYRALPSSYPQPLCTGRSMPANQVCNEVLNDTWVSFPLWSEDSTFGNSKISQYEEFMYRCEDERFELDVVIDSMSSTVQLLEEAGVKLTRLNADEAKAFQLDICLGGSSEVHPRKSIERIYGDRVSEVLESLMRRPYVAVPIVLRRLKSKIEEFREAKKNYIKLWKDECDKNYAKWLQSQATSYRQTDARQMRTKTLINEAEVAAEETFGDRYSCNSRRQEFVFASKSDLRNATNLIIHYLNYLPAVQTEDSFRISQMLHDTLPQLISMPTPRSSLGGACGNQLDDFEEQYAVMFANSGWYVFLRHFHLFCKRLEEIRVQCERLQQDENNVELIMHNGVKTYSYYEYMLNLMRMMVEGAIDSFRYETDMQRVLGSNAYITFSVEKILHNIVKQLQHLVSDDQSQQLMEMFYKERTRGAAGGCVSTAYRRQLAEYAYRYQAVQLVNDDYCFKIVFFKYKGLVRMELVDSDGDAVSDEQLSVQLRTVDYIDHYMNVDDVTDPIADSRNVFLTRNLNRAPAANSERKLRLVDKTRCLIGANSYKITFVNGSWSFMYREGSLSIARKTCSTTRKHKFHDWWFEWKSQNISADQERRSRDWLVRPIRYTRIAKLRHRDRNLKNTVE